jgi:hypothetical protein
LTGLFPAYNSAEPDRSRLHEIYDFEDAARGSADDSRPIFDADGTQSSDIVQPSLWSEQHEFQIEPERT